MDHRRTSSFLCCLLVCLLLVTACSAPPTATPPPPSKTPRPVFTEAPLPTATPASTATPTPTNTPVPTATPTPAINPLTGLVVPDPEVLTHRPILVRYGHDRQSRPPSGLSSADMVYEELAEGGFITRITGVYYSQVPDVVGPMRSSRPAVIDMMQQLDAVLVYSGASIGTGKLLAQEPYPQVTEGNSDLFFRSPNQRAPYNLYYKLSGLRPWLAPQKNDILTQDLRGMVFDPKAPEGTKATKIHIPYPGQAPVDYAYDAASGTYLRFVEGEKHIDALNGKQLAPANVIVLYAVHKNSDIVEDSLGNVAILITLMGEGRVQIFRDGVMLEGKWVRTEKKQVTRYKDASGQDIALKPGQSWIQIVPVDYKVVVQ